MHAIWGFSQGACLAGMLVALLGEKNAGHPLRAYFPQKQGAPAAGIFFAGFKARFGQYNSIYAPGINVPTMHVMGVKDDAVDLIRGEALVAICKNPNIVKHPGGHDIPKAEADREKIVHFLKSNFPNKERQSL